MKKTKPLILLALLALTLHIGYQPNAHTQSGYELISSFDILKVVH